MSVKVYEKVYLSSNLVNPPLFQFYNQSIRYYLNFLNNDYSNFNTWYEHNVIKGIFNKEREVICYMIQDQIAAISILKNTTEEKKISTIRVFPKYSHMGLGSQIFLDSFEYLDDEKPIITIPSTRLNQFSKLLLKYNFKFSYIDNLYNRNNNPEVLFNCK